MSEVKDVNIIEKVLNLRDNMDSSMKNYDVVNETADFITSCCYLTQHTAVDRVKAYIANDFDYKKTAQYLEERGIETSYNALKQSICYANKVLKKTLGSDVLGNLMKDGEIVRKRLVIARNDIKSILLDDTVKGLPEFKYMRYSLEDCEYELMFLARFSKSSFEFFKNKMDSRKLAYLNWLMTTPSDDAVAESLTVLDWLSKVKTGTTQEVKSLIGK